MSQKCAQAAFCSRVWPGSDVLQAVRLFALAASCECCGDVRDLNCRDPDLADGEWRCADAGCNNRYDLQWIEMKLCEEVNSASHTGARFEIKRCTRIKVGHVKIDVRVVVCSKLHPNRAHCEKVCAFFETLPNGMTLTF